MDNGGSYRDDTHDYTTYEYDSDYNNWTTANILPDDYQNFTDNEYPIPCDK